MHQALTVIRSIRTIASEFLELSFSSIGIDAPPLPGQFLTIRASDSPIPLLRRPFAYSGHNAQTGEASIIFQRRGPGTDILAAKQPGDTLDVIGPLGTSFAMDGVTKAIVVAGGIGLGPMLFLATALRDRGCHVRFVFGCRTKAMVPDLDAFRTLSPAICTDDGSAGFHGTTVSYLHSLTDSDTRDTRVFACGPTPMLKACHGLAVERGVRCQVSMEQTMACGVGACMGCVVKTVKAPGFARVCHEGPVFESGEILWEVWSAE